MTPPRELLYPASEGMKICSRKDCSLAGIPQPISQFDKYPKTKSGLTAHCKSCSKKYQRAWGKKWRKEHPEEARAKRKAIRRTEYHRAWYLRRREELNAATKAWRKANPEQVRELHIRRRFRQYGVTQEWYDRTLTEQGGKCAVCGSPDPKASWPTFHVDHDHTCCTKSCHACDKCRRGLLCAPCNTRIGIIENQGWLKAAMVYLERYR